jgi:putative effector of murein hydrolase
MLGGTPSITAGSVVVTGLLGANFGPRLLTIFNITEPTTRGLSIGAASHGLGTAAVKGENDAFPFAAIAMATVGTVTTVMATVGKGIIKRIVS